MATRIYLPNTGAAPISPTFGTWTETTGADRIAAVTTRISSVMTNKVQAHTATAANSTFLSRQYVIGPLAAQTYGASTIKGTIRVLESAANDNLDAMRLLVRVVAPDATNFRGTIYGPTNGTVLEFNTTLRAKRLATGGATTSVAITEGDYLVIDIGTTSTVGGTSLSDTISYGDDNATDLGDNETDTTALNPFIELTANMIFLQRGFGQAQASIKATTNKFAQAQAKVNAFGVKGFAQAQAALPIHAGYAQAQALIVKSKGLGQAAALISGTYFLPFTDTFTRTVVDSLGTSDNGDTWVNIQGTAANGDVGGSAGTLITQTTANEVWGLEKTSTVVSSGAGWEFSALVSLNKIPIDFIQRIRFIIPATSTPNTLQITDGVGLYVKVDTSGQITGQSIYGGLQISATTAVAYTPDDQYWIKAQIIPVSNNTAFGRVKLWKNGSAEPGWVNASLNNAGNTIAYYRYPVIAVDIDQSDGNTPFIWTFYNLTIKEANITYQAQAQAKINAFNVVAVGQAQADILATSKGFAQAQTDIEVTSNVFAQSQADIKATSNAFAQSQADIKATTNQFAQSQADIKATSNSFAQSQADVKVVTNAFAQSQADIKVTSNGFSQAQADIKATMNVFAQTQADIKATINRFAQSQADVTQTYNSFAQAQADIKVTSNVFAQSQADIKATRNAFAQSQADIVKATNVFSQAMARIGPTTYERLLKGIAGLQSFWTLGEASGSTTIGDHKGAISGTVNGTPTFGQASPNSLQLEPGVKFNSSTDYLTFGDNYDESSGTFTILMWVNPTNFTSSPSLISKKSDSSTGWDVSGHTAFTGFGTNVGTFLYNPLTAGQWNFFGIGALTGGGVTETFSAINDLLSDDPHSQFVISDVANSLTIGRNAYDTGNALSGSIGSVAIFNTAISLDDLQALYTVGKSGAIGRPAQAQARIKQTYITSAQSQADIRVTTNVFAQAQATVRGKVYAQAAALIAGTFFIPVTDTFTRTVVDGLGTSDNTDTWVLTAGTAADFDVNGTQGTVSTNDTIDTAQLQRTLIVPSPGLQYSGSFSFNALPPQGFVFVSLGTRNLGSRPDVADGLTFEVDAPDTLSLLGSIDITGGFITSVTYVANDVYNAVIQLLPSSNNKLERRFKLWKQGDIEPGWSFASEISKKLPIQSVVLSSRNLSTHTTIIATFDNLKIQAAGQTYYAQAQAKIKQTYNGFAQAQATIQLNIVTINAFAQAQVDIVQTYQGYGQSQGDIKQTYNVFAQSQADIKSTTNRFAQSQADIKATSNKFAQALAIIGRLDSLYTYIDEAVLGDLDYIVSPMGSTSPIEVLLSTPIAVPDYPSGHAIRFRAQRFGSAVDLLVQLVEASTIRASTQVSLTTTSTTYEYALTTAEASAITDYSNLRIRITPVSPGTDSRSIVHTAKLHVPKSPRRGFAQAKADIKVTTNRFAQSQADIKATSNSFAQAQADVKATSNAFSQAQADIKATSNGFGQAQADIDATTVRCAQAQADIKQTYQAYAQAQTWIKIISQGYGQAQADIKATSNGFGQAQADIKAVNNGYGQSNADIKQTYQGYAQAQADIVQTYQGYGQAQAQIKATYNGYAQSQADIKAVGYGFGQSQADIKQTYNGFAQAQADIDTPYQDYANAQASIKATYQGYGQGQGTILATSRGYGQAQSLLGTINEAYAQANAAIKVVTTSVGQSQADIVTTSNGFGQAQGTIKASYQTYAQAQGQIKHTYQGYAQAQAYIKTTGYGFGQAQGLIQAVVITRGYAQAQADILRVSNGVGNAQADILTMYAGYGQSEALIKNTYQAYSNTQSSIITSYQEYAQAQALIKKTVVESGNAEASILSTYYGFAQAKAATKVISYTEAQAQALILAGVANAQAQAYIRIAHILLKLRITDRESLNLIMSDRKSDNETITDTLKIGLTISDRPSENESINDRQKLGLTLTDKNYEGV